MTWTRIDEDWNDRVDAVDLSQSAELFHIKATIKCNLLLSDGLISSRTLRKLALDFANDHTILVAELVEKFGWTHLGDGVYQIPWDGQEASSAVKKRRAQAAERQRRYRDKGTDMKQAKLDGQRSESQGQSQDSVPIRSDPSRPEGIRVREDTVGGSSSPQSAAGAAPSATPPQARKFPDGIEIPPKPQWMIDMENAK